MKAITEQPANDAALVHRLQNGDKDALADLVDRHGSKMYGIALAMVRNDGAAQEILQDTLISVWKKIDSFQGHAQFTTWLYRVTANAGLMHLRKVRVSQRWLEPCDFSVLDQVIQRDDMERPDVAALRGELGEQVRQAIEALPQQFQTAVVLADIEELSMADIAGATGISIAGVKSRLHRGRLLLRRRLLPYLKSNERSDSTDWSLRELNGVSLGKPQPMLGFSE